MVGEEVAGAGDDVGLDGDAFLRAHLAHGALHFVMGHDRVGVAVGDQA